LSGTESTFTNSHSHSQSSSSISPSNSHDENGFLTPQPANQKIESSVIDSSLLEDLTGNITYFAEEFYAKISPYETNQGNNGGNNSDENESVGGNPNPVIIPPPSTSS
jgi:hypothetical protein